MNIEILFYRRIRKGDNSMDDEKLFSLLINVSHFKTQEEVTEMWRKAYEEEWNSEQSERTINMSSLVDLHIGDAVGEDTGARLQDLRPDRP